MELMMARRGRGFATDYLKFALRLGETSEKNQPVPMIWREATSHAEDCYFCLTKITGFSKKTRSKIEYPNVSSAIRPVPPGPKLPVPNPPSQLEELVLPIEQIDDLAQPSTFSDPSYSPEHHKELHLIQQCELNYLIRDLNLTKQQDEILGSRLQQWNLLAPDTKISLYRKRHERFSNLMKSFVKAMDKNGEGFAYVRNMFPKPSETEVKEGIFVGPQIRKLLKDESFEKKLNVEEQEDWNAFRAGLLIKAARVRFPVVKSGGFNSDLFTGTGRAEVKIEFTQSCLSIPIVTICLSQMESSTRCDNNDTYSGCDYVDDEFGDDINDSEDVIVDVVTVVIVQLLK
ncbi:hypothetical protein ANN_13189 [Periplaneta americana]|uniref:Uncharacterized protein n=1 Tax=Periplaneta americana TaxID=6978 RepID=A0ABQ8TKY8_PERAM|nr:hypothetical protein ANN_13189 [Periplaneta americana]